MIPLEKQVTSFILSQKLKNLGIKQEGIFAWYQKLDGSIFCEYCQYQVSQDNQSTFHDGYAKLPIKICIAPTVAELGEMLDSDTVSGKIAIDDENAKKYCCLHFSIPEFEVWDERTQFADTEANARAKMRIWLIENKLVGVK